MKYNITRSHELHVLKQLIGDHPAQRRTHCVLITHVLSTSENYIRLVNEVFPVVLVIAIPYSADPATIRSLEESGISVYVPQNIDEDFLHSGGIFSGIYSAACPVLSFFGYCGRHE